MTQPHCLILGASGQVATALSTRLQTSQYRVTTLGRTDSDLTDPIATRDAVLRLAPSVVINAAAYTAVDKAQNDQQAATALNVLGPAVAARAAREVGAPFIHFSTDYVFDGSKGEPYVETDAPCPLGVYGETKFAGEQAVAEANPEHLILRTAWVFSHTGSNFLRTMLRLAESREDISVVADQRGQPTFADDLAQSTLQIIDQLTDREIAGAWGVFHLTGSTDATWFDFATAIMAGARRRGRPTAAIRPITTADYSTPVRRPADSRLDCGLIERTYGVRLSSWENSLERCLDKLPTSTSSLIS